MRIVATSFGTTGDVEPMLALSAELRYHGHSVLLALPPIFEHRVEQLGLEFVSIGPYFDSETAHRMTLRVLAAGNPLWQARCYAQAALAGLVAMYRDLSEICSGADLLVSAQAQPAGRMVHDATGIPFVSVQFQTFTIPSAYRFLPSWPAPPRLALRPLWKMLAATWRLWTAGPINHYRKSAGLKPLPDPLLEDACSPLLALCAVSPAVIEVPADWPSHYKLTGYFKSLVGNWEPDPRLLEFLSGPAPIVVTFGSAVPRNPAATRRAIAGGIDSAGCRAIVQRGWSELTTDGGAALHIDYAPHAWLFRQAAAVVHHGGAGTTAAALLAGAPAVVVPHMLDQFEWAATCRRLGTSGPPLPARSLTAERLGQRLREVQRCKRAAKQLAARLAEEDGVGTARRLIEALVSA